MPPLTRIPPKIAYFLRGTQQFFRFRHQLVFCWTLVLILVYQDKATLKGLSRLGPGHLCEWPLRRFVCANYWCWRLVLEWMVQAVLDVRLRHVGDVALVLSKKRRNEGPHKTKILVTNLPQASTRLVVALYTRRWSVELLIKELKGVTGLGQAQVTKDPRRVERAVSLSVMAYLLLIRMQHQHIPQTGAWSAFSLKRSFAWEVIQQQLEHSFALRMRKILRLKKAA